MSGLFGVISEKSCRELLLYGTDYHSHLGTEFGGVAMLGDKFERQIHSISQSQFKSKFYEDVMNMKGDKGIGVVSAFDEQPVYLHSKFGPFCVVSDGFIDNADELAEELMSEGVTFSEVGNGTVNFTELAAKLIMRGDDLIDGISRMFDAIDGSSTLLVLNGDGIYAARDRLGYSSLTVGKRDDAWAVASETTAFPNNDLEIVK